MVDLIAAKRRGEEHGEAEIMRLVHDYVAGRVPDRQVAAWLMAVCFQGLTWDETRALTRAMTASGEQVDLSAVGAVVADKHSTGGVGDKVTLVLAPLVAACGVPFAKMSGRGLGHTGGTVDKLESIPGFRTEMSTAEFRSQVEAVGVAVVGATPDLVPADRLLYALRDDTATVDQEALIASSVMSKKIAGGATVVVLDVKVGKGAFLRDEAQAVHLARLMIGLGADVGRRVRCVLTPMDDPLGRAVGNALEVAEAMEVLAGSGPADVRDVAVTLCAHLLHLAGAAASTDEGLARGCEALDTGAAQEVCRRWFRAQGGDSGVVDGAGLPRAPVVREVTVSAGGWVRRVDARAVGRASLLVGVGRESTQGEIFHAGGVVLCRTRGDRVDAGDVVAHVHARDEIGARRAREMVRAAFEIGPDPPGEPRVAQVVG